ncbi:MAG: Na+/H+ antiporter NhaC family protein, partial [Gammaproteobacteria bacterium]
LSDTTNLAPAVTGTNLFDHIEHMVWTTVPSLIIAAIIFLIIGLQSDSAAELSSLDTTLSILQSQFNLSLWLLLPLFIVFFMAVKKIPAIATIFIGGLLGGVFAIIFQSDKILVGVDSDLSSTSHVLTTVWSALFDGYQSDSGNEVIDDLLSRGGMSSMLNTIWLIITALSFGAVLEHTGLLQRIVSSILSMVRSTGSLIASTVVTCIGCNILTADQYMAIVLPGRMYKVEFEKRGLDPRNLSRTLEDSATMTSALIPWNTCGAFMASTLGVATLAYLPFAFFNYLNPIISVIYGYTGFKLIPLEQGKTAQA